MKMTMHAKLRLQQRGFSKHVIDIILDKGRMQNAAGSATKFFLGRKERQEIVAELKRIIQLMDKAEGATIIIKDGHILTLYKK
jgi:hypothetical protein